MRDHYSDMDNSRNCHTSNSMDSEKNSTQIPAVTPARTVPRTVLRTAAAIPGRNKAQNSSAIPVRIRPRTPAGTTWITVAEINRRGTGRAKRKIEHENQGSADVLQMRPLIFFSSKCYGKSA